MMNWLRGSQDVYALIAKRSFGKARRLLEQELQEKPKSVHWRQLYADVLERQGEARMAVDVLARLADELAADGFTAKAIALLKKIQRIDPQTDIATHLAARIRRRAESAAGRTVPLMSPREEDEEIVLEALGEQAVEPPMMTSELVDDWFEPTEAARHGSQLSPLFRAFSVEALANLLGNLQLLVKKPGAMIFAQDEPGTSFYVLAGGYARVYRRQADLHHVQIELLKEGEIFGTGAVLDHLPRPVTVIAATECDLLELDGALFRELCVDNPEVRNLVETAHHHRLQAWGLAAF